MENQTQGEYDSPWKEALDVYFPEFMAFFFTDAYQEIDWEKGYETLDKEFQQIVQDANLGKRLADKLVKVWLKNSQETIILIHTEIQGQYESNFAERMYVYHYRIYDKYRLKNTEVVSLAVLGDDKKKWRPRKYSYSRWGCQLKLKFPIVKLLDYEKNWELLAESNNPFSVVIMAYLKSKETRKAPLIRLESKLTLVRLLYERGYSREMVIQLFRLIDWMMILPEELKRQFQTEVYNYEEEKKMPYITSIEEIGLEKGEQIGLEKGELKSTKESIITVLETRFENVPTNIVDAVNEIDNIQSLKQLTRTAVLIDSLESFAHVLSQK
ncbi:MAG: transposase [Okeania sp. SIO3B5]|uniref:transposase n=1 Tax=Okeania sp. SIO3B5 TaxID=2607811 RepID=UPI0014017842|nr:transposase [Okeania sp. SIO3B5]NEO52501.1 transposase [Okeania sp. SIO3B5]